MLVYVQITGLTVLVLCLALFYFVSFTNSLEVIIFAGITFQMAT